MRGQHGPGRVAEANAHYSKVAQGCLHAGTRGVEQDLAHKGDKGGGGSLLLCVVGKVVEPGQLA